jgi:outer membrane protein assembly factor BamA
MTKTQVCLLLLICPANLVFAEGQTPTTPETEQETIRVNKIVVISNPIFDESAPDSIFIHGWANYLHINTRESVVLNRLNFNAGDEVKTKDLEEAQRLLRTEAYIRDANVYLASKDPTADTDDEAQTIVVETWDNWSLLPTVSFSRSGGGSSASVGIKEDNLLGYGIRTRLRYQTDEDRTGYKFAFEAPFDWIKHATIGTDFYDNSDGQAARLYFDKPFYTLDGKHTYGFDLLSDDRTDTIRQNGLDINEFQHKVQYANLQYGWLVNKTDAELSRLITGFTIDNNEFDNIDSYPDSPLPEDRDFMYPWIAYEYLQDQFEVLTNVHLIAINEDYNLGWHHYIRLGLETKDQRDDSPLGYHLFWQTNRGYQSGPDLLLLSLGGKATFETRQKDFYQINTEAEYFYQINPKWTAYSKARLSHSKNNPLDQTFALGDETGVRGYANDYQHGDNQWLFTAELRHYPNINLYQLAELGWAAFGDIGQAFGGPDENNEHKGTIGSVGIGARIYSPKSSYGHVAHIDLSFPFTQGEDVNRWEWRFQVKSHF